MKSFNFNRIIEGHLTNKLSRSFLISCNDGNKNAEIIKTLEGLITMHFSKLKFDQLEIKSHTYILDSKGDSLKLKKKINNFENKLLNKPRKNISNIGIIDFDYILNTNNEYQRLLKILEEPPKHSQIYVITTSFKDIPKTIKSRLITIPYDEKTQEAQLSLDFKQEIGLNDLAKKIKGLTSSDLDLFFKNHFPLSKITKLTYNQLSYIQKIIKNATEHHRLNLRPLDSELKLIKKMNQEKN